MLPGAESVEAAVALRNLKTYAESAIKHLFAVGCMVTPGNPTTVDSHSHDYVRRHFSGAPLKKFLRALRTAKAAASDLIKHMDLISNGDGDPEQGKLSTWLRQSATQSHHNQGAGTMSSVTVMDRDLMPVLKF